MTCIRSTDIYPGKWDTSGPDFSESRQGSVKPMPSFDCFFKKSALYTGNTDAIHASSVRLNRLWNVKDTSFNICEVKNGKSQNSPSFSRFATKRRKWRKFFHTLSFSRKKVRNGDGNWNIYFTIPELKLVYVSHNARSQRNLENEKFWDFRLRNFFVQTNTHNLRS